MKLLVVYDDRKIVANEVSAFVSVSSYGSIVFRQKTLSGKMQAICTEKNWAFCVIEDAAALAKIKQSIAHHAADRVLWLSASLAPLGGTATINQMERMLLVDGNCVGTGPSDPHEAVAFDAEAKEVLEQILSGKAIDDVDSYVDLSQAFVDVADLTNLVDYLSGALGARHFNSVKRSARKIIKFSTDKKKMKAEHDYFHLLPSSMKHWLVMPFDYEETEDGASYSMERLMLLDMGQQWINGGMSLLNFQRFLEDVFQFVDERPRKKISKEEARTNFTSLYVDKVKHRFADFQKLEIYQFADSMVRSATGEPSLASVYERYYSAIAKYIDRTLDYACIGHGDPCFSNILYDRRTRMLKLIDPKGATSEGELFTHPLYDIAKLSHSILGGYDYISNGLYDITLGTDLRLHLHTPEAMYAQYGGLFINELAARDLDPSGIRLLEASLFLSMLPLHRDKPRNILAFILIAINILREVENNAHV